MYLLILLLITSLILFYKYVEHAQTHWKRLRVTSPTPTFFVGSYLENFKGKINAVEIYEDLYNKFKKSDRVIGLYQFLKPQLLIVDASLAKDILVKYFSNFHDTSFSEVLNPESDPLLARNPFFLSGQEWKDKRAEITPAFSPARIKAMFPLVEQICERIETYLEKKQGESIEARDLCSRYTCDVVSNCIFSADAGSFYEEKPEIRRVAAQIFATGVWANLKFLFAMMIPAISKILKLRFVPKETQDFFTDLMAQAVENRRKLGISRQDYLEYLLQMQGKKKVSELELAANGITFFIDGFETSSVAIACTLYELATNKNVQERLREELKNVNGYEQITENEYLDAVFAEGLRLHPPAGVQLRECTADIELDLLGKEKKLLVKKGNQLLIPTYCIQRDENIYESPVKFKPDRFLNGEMKRFKDDVLYFPFGAGPRTCIGQKFAQAQSKACIATIIKNFKIDLDTDKTKLPLKLNPTDFITYYEGGIYLKFEKISL